MSDLEPFLEGVKVLDFTQYLAGPTCTRLLVELGADVIKVEMSPLGDPARGGSPRINRRGGYHVQQNRGKKSLCLDMKSPEAIQIIKDLIPHMDVVVENYSAGVLARRGLAYDDLKEINPKLIMASISGFGQTGMWSHKTSFDLIAQAVSGITAVTGDPDGSPMIVGAGIGDCSAGVHAFAGIGHALFRRERTGKGTHLDISMVDSLFHMHEINVHGPSMTNGEFKAERGGAHHPAISPAGVFKAPEGYIVILCTGPQVPYLWEALGRPELADDPKFHNQTARNENRDELVAMVEEWMAQFATDAECLEALEASRVPCGPVLNPADALDHPYFIERNMVREVTDPLAGTFKIPGNPIKFVDNPPEQDLHTPNLGEHNHEILTEMLGYSPEQATDFADRGILASKNR